MASKSVIKPSLNLNINQAIDEVSQPSALSQELVAKHLVSNLIFTGAHHPRHRPLAHQVRLRQGFGPQARACHSTRHGQGDASKYFINEHGDVRRAPQRHKKRELRDRRVPRTDFLPLALDEPAREGRGHRGDIHGPASVV